MFYGKCVRHRWKQVVVGRGQVWWVRRVEKVFSAKCKNGVSDRFRCVIWGVIVLQIHFFLFCTVSPGFRSFRDTRHFSDPTKCTELSSFQSDSVLRSMLMVVLGQTHDILHFKFSKYIHVSSPVTCRRSQMILRTRFNLSAICRWVFVPHLSINTCVFLLIEQKKQYVPQMFFIWLGTRHVYHTKKIRR